MQEVIQAARVLRNKACGRGGILPARLGKYPAQLRILGRDNLRIELEQHPHVTGIEMTGTGKRATLSVIVNRLVIPTSIIGAELSFHLEGSPRDLAAKEARRVAEGELKNTVISAVKIVNSHGNEVLVADKEQTHAPFILRKEGENLVLEPLNQRGSLRLYPSDEDALQKVLERHARAVARRKRV